MFPTYGSGIQQGYWDGSRFIAPPAQSTPQQPVAVPVPQQSLLPQAQPIQEPVRQGLLDGGDGPGSTGPAENSGSIGIGDVNGGVVGNLGTIGSIAGLGLGVPGLGMMGAIGQTAAETTGYENDLAAMNFQNNFTKALMHNMTSGVFGMSTHNQARDAVRGHSMGGTAAGDTNAFGGKVAGRMSDQSRVQGRGGAAPEGQNSGSANSGQPGMGGVADPDAPGGYGTPGGIGSGDGASSKIICTEMNRAYGFGSFRNAIWMRHAVGLHPAYQRGYHALFRPVLTWARKRETLTQCIVMRVLEWGTRHRTADIWKERHGRRDLIGRAVRGIFDNLCYIVGRFL